MKFTGIVRDRYRGPAYGQEFTTWFAKVRHGFSTAQVPADAQVDHLVAVLESPAQELAFSFCEKYDIENSTDGLRGANLTKYHEDKLAALVAHLQSKSAVVGTRPESTTTFKKREVLLQKQGHNFESTACRVLRAMSPRYDLRCQAPEVELVNSKPVRNKPPTHPHLNSSSRTRGHIAAAGLLARHIRCSINL